MAPKDAVAVKGFPTTWGFKPFAERIETQDSTLAARMRKAGAILSATATCLSLVWVRTLNAIFGAIKSLRRLQTAGGSSGGAAVALATDMLPLAIVATWAGRYATTSFCNVVGLRPSIGRTPFSRGYAWYGRLVSTGPMAKTVADTSLLFSILAGPDRSDPLTLPEPANTFLMRWCPLSTMLIIQSR